MYMRGKGRGKGPGSAQNILCQGCAGINYNARGPWADCGLSGLRVSILIFQLGKDRALSPMQWSTAEPKALKHHCCSNSHLGGIGVSGLESLPTSAWQRITSATYFEEKGLHS